MKGERKELKRVLKILGGYVLKCFIHMLNVKHNMSGVFLNIREPENLSEKIALLCLGRAHLGGGDRLGV